MEQEVAKISKAFILRTKNGDVRLEELNDEEYELLVGQSSIIISKVELDSLFDLRYKL